MRARNRSIVPLEAVQTGLKFLGRPGAGNIRPGHHAPDRRRGGQGVAWPAAGAIKPIDRLQVLVGLEVFHVVLASRYFD